MHDASDRALLLGFGVCSVVCALVEAVVVVGVVVVAAAVAAVAGCGANCADTRALVLKVVDGCCAWFWCCFCCICF